MGTIAEVKFNKEKNGVEIFTPFCQIEQLRAVLKIAERHRLADDIIRGIDKAIEEGFESTIVIIKPDFPGQKVKQPGSGSLWGAFCSAAANVSKDNRVAVALVREDEEELVITATDVETGTSHRFEISAKTVSDSEKLGLALEKIVEQVGEAAAKAKAEREDDGKDEEHGEEGEPETSATEDNEASVENSEGDEETTTSENDAEKKPMGKGKKGGKGKTR